MAQIRLPLLPTWARWLAVVAVAVIIFYASVVVVPPSEPVVPGKPDFVPLDKWRHFLAYAGFAGTLAYATTDWERPRWQIAAVVVGTAVAFGIGVEFAQAQVPYRYFSVEDAYANALGGLLVTPLLRLQRHVEWVGVTELSP
ncbi:VanZ family protein [Haloarculaceae archaeon H-GB2-1]|nr:VanZ family protein [Haloarculaceae archaeon H-GB1-1]MEA5387669.1 VanZ family protein [Haloarculaceae archaeon H-GB11]MEA5409154.1 VanZ family protein [Haloarculaceae archaeon H-GB2-1]